MSKRDTHKSMDSDLADWLEWCNDCGASGDLGFMDDDLDLFTCEEYQKLHPRGRGSQINMQIQPDDYDVPEQK